MTEGVHTGGCLCGAVRYEARGAPWNVRMCHCTLCRRATGQPFFARALFPASAVTVTGETAGFDSSAHLRRIFCPACGTRLFAKGLNEPARLGIALGTLDDPEALPPTEHIYVSTKLSWLNLDDGLPQYPERPPG